MDKEPSKLGDATEDYHGNLQAVPNESSNFAEAFCPNKDHDLLMQCNNFDGTFPDMSSLLIFVVDYGFMCSLVRKLDIIAPGIEDGMRNANVNLPSKWLLRASRSHFLP